MDEFVIDVCVVSSCLVAVEHSHRLLHMSVESHPHFMYTI